MAQVRIQEAPSVEPSTSVPFDYQNIRATPDSFGGLIGQGEQRLGAGAQQAGGDLIQAALARQERYNQVASTDAYNQFLDKAQALTYGDPNDPSQKGYYQLTGQDAVRALKPAQKSLDDTRSQILNTLPTAAARMEFQAQSKRLQMFTLDSMGRHYDQQSKVWGANTNAATEDLQARLISSQWNDDGAFSNGVHDIRMAAIRGAQSINGDNLGPALQDEALAKADNKAITSRVLQWGNSDPSGAMKWLDNGMMPNPVPGQPDVPVRSRLDGQTYQMIKQKFRSMDDLSTATTAVQHATATPVSGNVPSLIMQEASASGVLPVHALTVAKLESDFGTRPDEAGNSHTGIFRTGPQEKAASRGPISPVTGVPQPTLTTVKSPDGAAFRVDASVAPAFQGLIGDLEDAGYKLKPETSSGYNDRFIRGTTTPSMHAYGRAIDVNADENPNGENKNSTIPADLANRLAQKWGLTWGGNWSGKDRDPMHFEAEKPTEADPGVQVREGVTRLKHAGEITDNVLGRQAAPWEQYVTYQQGDTGGPALLKANPTSNVIDALTPAYNGDRAAATLAIVRNGGSPTMTAGDFVGLVRAKYQDAEAQVGGIPAPNTATPAAGQQTEASAMQRILQDPSLKDRPEAMEHALGMVSRQFAIQRQERQEASTQAGNAYITQMLKDPFKVDIRHIADDPNLTGEQKWNLSRMLNEAVSGTRGDKQATEYGPGIYKYLQMVTPQPGQPTGAVINPLGQTIQPPTTTTVPPQLSDPTELWGKVPTGELTIAGVEKLTQIMQGSKTLDGQNDNRLFTQFIDASKQEISKHGGLGGLQRDPKGEQLFVDFLTQAMPAFSAGRAAGKSAADLLNSKSPDYIGKIIPQFIRPQSVWVKDLIDANGQDATPEAAAPAGLDLTTAPGVVAAYTAKKIDYFTAQRMLEKFGVPHRTAEQAPAVATAPPAPPVNPFGAAPSPGSQLVPH